MQQAATHANGTILTAIVVALFFLAVFRSPRRLRTAGYILGVMVVCGLVGTGIGFLLRNPEAAGELAGLLMQVGGIVASIERMRRHNKAGSIGR